MATKKEEQPQLRQQDIEPKKETNALLPPKKEFPKEELLKVFDELIFNGEYREDVTIKGKLKVTFRTRTTEETMEVSKLLDGTDHKLLVTVQEQRAFHNLCKSLVTYQGRDVSNLKVEDKEKFIKKLPTSIASALADALSEFDLKVDYACREGEENF